MNGLEVEKKALIARVPDTNWRVAGVGDLDRDGKADIVWRNVVTGDTAVWLIDGAQLLTGTVVATTALLPNVPLAWSIAAVADYDGDYKADILWRNASTGDNAIWLMDGTVLSTSALIHGVSDPEWQIAGIGDYDADGRSDIFWRNAASGENAIWLMNGFTLKSGGLVPGVPDRNWSVVRQ